MQGLFLPCRVIRPDFAGGRNWLPPPAPPANECSGALDGQRLSLSFSPFFRPCLLLLRKVSRLVLTRKGASG
jgi:hypothetical protein